MPYCKKCGAELPEYAVFCSKCGVKKPLSNDEEEGDYAVSPQTEQPIAQEPAPQPAAPTQSSAPITQSTGNAKSTTFNAEWFKNNFMLLYVILGVVSIVLLQFATLTAFTTFGFGVTLAVFSILCAIAFCAVGAIKYFISANAGEGKTHTTCEKLCLALGIIGFIYVLVTSIIVLKTASDLLDAMDVLINAML